jgi:hypothetical protein
MGRDTDSRTVRVERNHGTVLLIDEREGSGQVVQVSQARR